MVPVPVRNLVSANRAQRPHRVSYGNFSNASERGIFSCSLCHRLDILPAKINRKKNRISKHTEKLRSNKFTGRSPVCDCMWTANLAFCRKAFSHIWHLCGRISLCVLMCKLNELRWRNVLEHKWHMYGLCNVNVNGWNVFWALKFEMRCGLTSNECVRSWILNDDDWA